MKEIAYQDAALNALARIPKPTRKRILEKIEQYATDPTSLANNVTRLTGKPAIRLRVGDWRVIMDDTGAVLDVLKIGPRGGVYDRG